MTLQAKILPWSFCGPSHIPPLLLSSSKGLREKKVDCDGCFVCWDVFSLERKHHTVPLPPNSTSVAESNCNYCKVQQDSCKEKGGTGKGTALRLSSFVVVMDGTVTPTILHRLPHRFFKRGQLWRWVVYCCFGTVLSRKNETFGLVLTFEFHVDIKESMRKIVTQNQHATNFSEPSQGGFFSVLSARDFQEKKS